MQEFAIEAATIITANGSAESAVLSELESELLDRVGGGGLSWSY
jgi:hypothetical protein